MENNNIIYIGSPYSHPDENIRIERFNQVTIFAAQLVSKGYTAISPITYGHLLLDYKKMPTEFEFWNKFCISLLSKCSDIYIYKIDGWQESKGLKAEIEFAEKNNINVKYFEYGVY